MATEYELDPFGDGTQVKSWHFGEAPRVSDDGLTTIPDDTTIISTENKLVLFHNGEARTIDLEGANFDFGTQKLTFMFSFRFQSFSNLDQQHQLRLQFNGGGQFPFSIYTNTSNQVRVKCDYLYGGAGTADTGYIYDAPADTMFIVATMDGTNSNFGKLYVDGVYFGEGENTNTPIGTDSVNFDILSFEDNVNAIEYDNIRIFNRILTDEEIATLCSPPAIIVEPTSILLQFHLVQHSGFIDNIFHLDITQQEVEIKLKTFIYPDALEINLFVNDTSGNLECYPDVAVINIVNPKQYLLLNLTTLDENYPFIEANFLSEVNAPNITAMPINDGSVVLINIETLEPFITSNKVLVESILLPTRIRSFNAREGGGTHRKDILGDGSDIASYPFDGNALDNGGIYDGVEDGTTTYTTSDVKYDEGISLDSDHTGEVLVNVPVENRRDFTISFFCFNRGAEQGYLVQLETTVQESISFYNNILRVAFPFQEDIVTLNYNQLYHLAFVFESNGDIIVYVDGVAEPIKGYNAYSGNILLQKIGGGGSSLQSFNGNIDQFRIFNRALEVRDILSVIDEYGSLGDNAIINVDSISIVIEQLEAECVVNTIAELMIEPLYPNYIGFVEGSVGSPYPNNIVFAQTIPLTLVAHYLQHPDNAYIQPQVLKIITTILTQGIWENVFPETFNIPISINSSIAQNDGRDNRVTKLGNIVFDKALHWSANNNVQDFISTTALTVNGETVYSVTPLKKFTRSYEISTKTDIIVGIDKINELKALISTDEIRLEFNDGSWKYVKFDLLDIKIKMIPIFEGSDKYYLTIGVLL